MKLYKYKHLVILVQKPQASVSLLVFQNDPDPKYTSKSTKEWLSQKKINVF